MNEVEVRKRVAEEYKVAYKDCSDFRIDEVILDVFDGHMAAVSFAHAGIDNSELCFVYASGKVLIYNSTPELLRDLERRAKAPLFDRLFTRPILSGIVFLFLLVAVFIIGFFGSFKPEALAILGSVVGVAAGFFFGTGKSPS